MLVSLIYTINFTENFKYYYSLLFFFFVADECTKECLVGPGPCLRENEVAVAKCVNKQSVTIGKCVAEQEVTGLFTILTSSAVCLQTLCCHFTNFFFCSWKMSCRQKKSFGQSWRMFGLWWFLWSWGRRGSCGWKINGTVNQTFNKPIFFNKNKYKNYY